MRSLHQHGANTAIAVCGAKTRSSGLSSCPSPCVRSCRYLIRYRSVSGSLPIACLLARPNWRKRYRPLSGPALDRARQLLSAVGIDRSTLSRPRYRDIGAARVDRVRPEAFQVYHRSLRGHALAAVHRRYPTVPHVAVGGRFELQCILVALARAHPHRARVLVNRGHSSAPAIDAARLTVVPGELHLVPRRELSLGLDKAVDLAPAPFVEPPIDFPPLAVVQLDPVRVGVDLPDAVGLAALDPLPRIVAPERHYVARFVTARMARLLAGQPLGFERHRLDRALADRAVTAKLVTDRAGQRLASLAGRVHDKRAYRTRSALLRPA